MIYYLQWCWKKIIFSTGSKKIQVTFNNLDYGNKDHHINFFREILKNR